MFAGPKESRLPRGGWRVFWAVMLVAHTPAWLKAFGLTAGVDQSFDTFRCLVLTASQLFFVLKFADLRPLRFRADRRTWLTLALILVLLHAGLVPRALHVEFASHDALPASIGLAALAAVAYMLATRDRPRSHASRRHRNVMPRLALRRMLGAFLPPRYLLLNRACLINRAPPR